MRVDPVAHAIERLHGTVTDSTAQAGANDNAREAALKWLNEPADLFWAIGAVAIEHNYVIGLTNIVETGSNSVTLTLLGFVDDPGAGLMGDCGGVIRRVVVDHKYV